jgi:PGF-CTERM protein
VGISTTSTYRGMLYDLANSIDYIGIAALGEGAVPPSETAHPTEQPTQPPPTKTPTTSANEEKTPGFEAVFAIAGLLVVYLLRRRK